MRNNVWGGFCASCRWFYSINSTCALPFLFKIAEKPTKCLLQKVAFSPSLCKKAYFTGRLLGLSKDVVDVCESVTFHDKLDNPAERFLSKILKEWESKSHHGECTIAALLRVVIFLKSYDALDKVLEHVQNPVLEQ